MNLVNTAFFIIWKLIIDRCWVWRVSRQIWAFESSLAIWWDATWICHLQTVAWISWMLLCLLMWMVALWHINWKYYWMWVVTYLCYLCLCCHWLRVNACLLLLLQESIVLTTIWLNNLTTSQWTNKLTVYGCPRTAGTIIYLFKKFLFVTEPEELPLSILACTLISFSSVNTLICTLFPSLHFRFLGGLFPWNSSPKLYMHHLILPSRLHFKLLTTS